MTYRADLEAALARVDALERDLHAEGQRLGEARQESAASRQRADELARELEASRAEVARLRARRAPGGLDVAPEGAHAEDAPAAGEAAPPGPRRPWLLSIPLAVALIALIVMLPLRGFPGTGVVAFGLLGVLVLIPALALALGAIGLVVRRSLRGRPSGPPAVLFYYLLAADLYFAIIFVLHELGSSLVRFQPAG